MIKYMYKKDTNISKLILIISISQAFYVASFKFVKLSLLGKCLKMMQKLSFSSPRTVVTHVTYQE